MTLQPKVCKICGAKMDGAKMSEIPTGSKRSGDG